MRCHCCVMGCSLSSERLAHARAGCSVCREEHAVSPGAGESDAEVTMLIRRRMARDEGHSAPALKASPAICSQCCLSERTMSPGIHSLTRPPA